MSDSPKIYNGTLTTTGRFHAAVAAAILLAAGAVYSVRLSAPFEHYHENVTACYGSWGRNYLRFGYAVSGGAPIKAVGIRPPTLPVPRQIYSHRPPTVSLLMSLSTRLFGPVEAATRVVGLAASIATLAVFGLLARRLLGATWGLVATSLFAFIPDIAFYGVAIAHQTFGILGGLAIVLATLWWRERPDLGRLAGLLGVVVVACWTDWPAFYAAGAAGLLVLLAGGERRWIGPLLPAAAVVSLGLFVLYLYRLDPATLVPLKDFLSTGSSHHARVPLVGYLASHAREAIRWFTVPVLLSSAIGSGLLRPQRVFEHAAILATVLLGADSVLFPSLASGHLFLTAPLAPFMALTAACGLRALVSWKPGVAIAAVLAVGFVVQSTLVLSRAYQGGGWTFPNESARALSETLKKVAGPGERTLVRLDADKHVLGFYADRPIVLYSAASRSLDWLDEVRIDQDVDDDAVLRLLDRPPAAFSWFVTTTFPLAAERIASVKGLSAAAADPAAFARERFGFEDDRAPSPLLARLRERYPEIRRDGFLFFDLRRPR